MNPELKELIERAVNAWYEREEMLAKVWDAWDLHGRPRRALPWELVEKVTRCVQYLEPDIEGMFPECKFTRDPHNKKWMLVMYNGQSV